MLGGARKAAGPGYGTKITELMNLHLDLGFSRIANVVSDRCWKILSGHICPQALIARSFRDSGTQNYSEAKPCQFRISSRGKFYAQPPKGKYYASNRNYILDLCRDGALEWRLKKGGSMPEKKDVQVVKHKITKKSVRMRAWRIAPIGS